MIDRSLPGWAFSSATVPTASRPITSSLYRWPQPPCVKPPRGSSSGRPRPCTTPSRVTHIVTVIERMDLLPSVLRAALLRSCHLLYERSPARSTPPQVTSCADAGAGGRPCRSRGNPDSNRPVRRGSGSRFGHLGRRPDRRIRPSGGGQDRSQGVTPSRSQPCAQLGSRTVEPRQIDRDRKSTRLNSSHSSISYAVFCLK